MKIIPFAFPQNNDIYSDSQVAGKCKELPFFSDFQSKKGVQCSKFCLNLEKTHMLAGRMSVTLEKRIFHKSINT